MMGWKMTSAALCATVVLAAACGAGVAPSAPVGPAAALTIASGDAQEGEVAVELAAPVVIRVVDMEGRPVTGQSVTFRVTAGGGSVFAGAGVSGADGLVQERWTLGTGAGGDHEVVARAVSSSGQALPELKFRAMGRPAAAQQLSIEVEPELALYAGESTQLQLQGRDRFGNAIAGSGLSASWFSSAPAVAVVEGAGLVRGVAPGVTTVTVQSGSVSAQRTLHVLALRQSLYAVEGDVVGFAGAGERLLAYGTITTPLQRQGAVWRWTGSDWEHEVSLGLDSNSLWVFPSGEAWLGGSPDANGVAGRPPLWSSPSTGAWQQVDVTVDWVDWSRVTGVGADVVVQLTLGHTSVNGRSTSYPVVRRRIGGTWTDLSFPVTVDGKTHQAGRVAARSAAELYVGGTLEQIQYGGRGEPSLGYWNGTGWSFPQLPPLPGAPGLRGVSALVASPGAGPVYGVLDRTLLVALREGAVSLVENPLTEAGTPIEGVAIGPSGGLYLFYQSGLAWQQEGEWKTQPLTGGWQGGGGWVAPDRTVWRALYRVTSASSSESRVAAFRQL